jgi:hypothetical protein
LRLTLGQNIDGPSSSRAAYFDKPRLRASILLFKWIYGEEALASERYLREERDYKTALAEEWRGIVTNETLSRGRDLQGCSFAVVTSVSHSVQELAVLADNG